MNASTPQPTDGTPTKRGTKSRRKRTVWQIAPSVPQRGRRIQFGIGTLLVTVSLGGPLLAAAMMVPREFYQLNAQLAAAVACCCVVAFALSFCRPYWALGVMVLAILFGLAAHTAVYTNRFHLGDDGSLKLLAICWATMIATGSGFLLACSRYDQ